MYQRLFIEQKNILKAGGYIATIKSGVVTFKNDEATGELPGTVLRGADGWRP